MEKTIKLTVGQARKMLGKSETMDALIKANFSEEELRKKDVEKWEDLEIYEGFYMNEYGNVGYRSRNDGNPISDDGRNILFAERNQLKGSLAMIKLSQLMKRFLANNEHESWKPDWKGFSNKWVIYYEKGEIVKGTAIEQAYFLAFPSSDLRDRFLELHIELIEEYFLIYQ